MASEKVVFLQAGDVDDDNKDKLIKVDEKIIAMSGTIAGICEDITGIETPIPLPNVTYDLLQTIIAFCEHYKNVPDLDIKNKYKQDVKVENWEEFDRKYCTEPSVQRLCDLIRAANYLNIKQLIELMVLYLARQIKGMSVEEIEKYFIAAGQEEYVKKEPVKTPENENPK